ncbi:hypothetical protein [Brevibacterium sp. UCMA 11752]|uniref:hypothetical protein n=1 Tax=Brevibacterium sp. UCMA 11752 TaxID=2745946 RepID=UPI0022869D7A|nr:hypothetical protein [Brevibacterium sp. UCMA 11752]MCF2588440.1 hypothetical protein [Brevibacterium sp. UCMA 11752]
MTDLFEDTIGLTASAAGAPAVRTSATVTAASGAAASTSAVGPASSTATSAIGPACGARGRAGRRRWLNDTTVAPCH